METVIRDLRYGLRRLLREPAFTTVAIVTLALGIGANTAIFSVVNAVLLRPLPYRDPSRLVTIWGNFLKLNIERLPAKAAEYDDYENQKTLFDAVAAFDNQNFTLTGGEQPERIRASHVTSNLFALLGAQAELGRMIMPEENQAGRDSVVVLAHDFWERHFAGDGSVVNQEIDLDGRSYRVVGVMPAGFQFPYPGMPSNEPADLWVPLVYSKEQVTRRAGPYYLNILARLRSGVTLEQSRTEMASLALRMEREQHGYRGPNGEDGGWRIMVQPLQEEIVGSSRRTLFILLAAVCILLLIACANVANLLLVRAAKRQKELAIRAALGASRRQIVKQLLVEGLLLATLGSLLGLVFAQWGLDLLFALRPASLPRINEIDIDSRVLAFTGTMTIVTSVCFSFISFLQASDFDLQPILNLTTAVDVRQWRHWRWSSALIIGEVALAVMLLISSGLLINSFVRLQHVEPGMAIDHLLTAEISLSPTHYREPAQATAFFNELIQHMQSLPGVQGVTYSTMQPLSGAAHNDPFAIEGRPLDPANLTSAGWQTVGAEYLHTLGIPLVAGRDFSVQDTDAGAPVVAVINERMASRYWPNENPIGRRITLGLPRADNPWITIIGIARSVPHRAIDSQPEPDWYLSRALSLQNQRYLFVRSSADPAALAAAIRREVAAIDKDQPVTGIGTLSQVIAKTTAPRRFSMVVVGIFAVIALMLAMLGIYSVISYSVAQRTREIGVRLAVGAQRASILKLVIKRGMSLALIGTVIGVSGAFALTRLLASLLFEISPTHATTFISVSILALLAALAACLLPARRATSVDPLVALRYE